MPYKNFDEILNNIKRITGARNQKEVASALGISGSAITDAKNRNVIPETWYRIIEERFGSTREQLCGLYLGQRQEEAGFPQPVTLDVPGKGAMAGEKLTIAAKAESSEQDEISENEAVEMMLNVIRSKTIHRSVLLSNIRAFNQAVEKERENAEMKDQLAEVNGKVDRIEQMLLMLTEGLESEKNQPGGAA